MSRNTTGTNDHTKGINETEEIHFAKLDLLQENLDQLSSNASYQQAQSKCPDILDDGFHLLFLRCERWNVDLAAKRMARYWDERLVLFGNVKAFEPLTLNKALLHGRPICSRKRNLERSPGSRSGRTKYRAGCDVSRFSRSQQHARQS